jgi:hypothetical protein
VSELRAWLAGLEDALAMARAAIAASRHSGRMERTPATWLRLLDHAADSGHLASIAPGGALPADFPRRALRLAVSELENKAGELPGLGAAISAPPAGRLAVSAPVVSRGRRISVGRPDVTFESRVQRALGLLDRAWPEAAGMVRDRTRRVVPVIERGTVSFSSPHEPGLSFINIRSSPLVRLAEDLLHEATHMRIHEIESVRPLVRRSADPVEGEGRFYSPWRWELRPVRGILHGACTFTVGARFFEMMLRASEPGGPVRLPASRRLWLAGRLLEEMDNVRMALRTLRRAGRDGPLRPAGLTLVGTVSRERRRLGRAARSRARWLSGTTAGRSELARLARTARRHSEKLHALGEG